MIDWSKAVAATTKMTKRRSLTDWSFGDDSVHGLFEYPGVDIDIVRGMKGGQKRHVVERRQEHSPVEGCQMEVRLQLVKVSCKSIQMFM